MAGTTANLKFTAPAVDSSRLAIQNPLRVYSFASLRFIVGSFFYHFRFRRRATMMTSYTNGMVRNVMSSKVAYKCFICVSELQSFHCFNFHSLLSCFMRRRNILSTGFPIFGYDDICNRTVNPVENEKATPNKLYFVIHDGCDDINIL